jgi:hypothetical protein
MVEASRLQPVAPLRDNRIVLAFFAYISPSWRWRPPAA